jgi:hypothetical protein
MRTANVCPGAYTQSCTINIPMIIPANMPAEKTKRISFIAMLSWNVKRDSQPSIYYLLISLWRETQNTYQNGLDRKVTARLGGIIKDWKKR